MKIAIKLIKKLRHSLVFKLILFVGITLLLSIATWAYFNIKYQDAKLMEHTIADADRLSNTIMLGTRYAMMLNSREDINQIIKNIGSPKELKNIRIYNKKGEIKYSNNTLEVGKIIRIQSEVCYVCHLSEPPLSDIDLSERARMSISPNGYRQLEIISPIYNESGCSTDTCHIHLAGKKVLGTLGVVVSLEESDEAIFQFEMGIIALAAFVFLVISMIIFGLVLKFVNLPMKKLIIGAQKIAEGNYFIRLGITQEDEMGQLAAAIKQMGREIGEKQDELNRQKEEYRNLFENSPCYITVQDKNFRLLRYNREFGEKFDPKPGDYCYHAYKGRSERCEICPVAGTFEDGNPRTSEETGINKDGTRSFWMVRTSPIKDSTGEVTAAMEMSLDVTQMKFLENEVRKSEQKYRTIFNAISSPIFVLDRKNLNILDCNDSATDVYGYYKDEILNRSFVDFFTEEGQIKNADELKKRENLNKIKHRRKDGEFIYVNIYISPSEYMGREVLLVTTDDITDRLMAEQQLIQASKMATLGQMATGIAHELFQPLSVIKMACGYFLKKVQNKEPVKDSIMEELATEMDDYVNRATKIINHMREFGHQSDIKKTTVQINEVLEKAYEIFSQQLKLREIEVEMDLERDLPAVLADPNRLEQVFINLLTNARDAIEEKEKERTGPETGPKKISIKTSSKDKIVAIEVRDTGIGIPDSTRDKIYDPFFTTKEVGTGTGLGLSISYGIIQDYNGTIELQSSKEGGSVFIIKFPISGMGNGTKNPYSG